MIPAIKKIVLLAVIAAVLSPVGRTQEFTRGNLTMGATVSLNSTRLVSDSIKYGGTVLPGIGAGFYSSLTYRLLLHYGGQFSLKGTNDFDTLGQLRTYTIEPYVSLQFKPVENLRIEAGALYSRLMLAQTIKATGESSTGSRSRPIEGFKSYPEFFAGIHLDLSKQIYGSVRYYLPLANQEFRRLEFRVMYVLIQGYTKRRRG